MNMVIAVVEPNGALTYFQRMTGSQYASIKIAQEKAISAALFGRFTKTFRERVEKGDLTPMESSELLTRLDPVKVAYHLADQYQQDEITPAGYNLSTLVLSAVSWWAVEAEIAKCEVRCANCHRRRTALIGGFYRVRAKGLARIDEPAR